VASPLWGSLTIVASHAKLSITPDGYRALRRSANVCAGGDATEETEMTMNEVLITGANRGLGRALVERLLARGVGTIHATARDPATLAPLVRLDERRIKAHALDITDPAALARVANEVRSVDTVINNAGVLASYDVLTADLGDLRRDLETNTLGTLHVARAFAPGLIARGGGALVNVLSVAALANMPMIGGYSASKAGALSISQALRATLRPKGVRVHVVLPGPIDTDMTKSFELVKTSPRDVAEAIISGVIAGEEDIAPDPMSQGVLSIWRNNPRAVEVQFAG
jgi:short-subunit dehydrogenase